MRINHKLLGIVFVAMLMMGVWATYGVFTKKFTDYDEVTLKTSTIGLNLPARADVKIRGVIVGEVLELNADSDGAELTLGIFPEMLHTIPANVTGSLVPKTLFGEKYVALEVPVTPAKEPLKAGAVIARTELAIEVEQVLNDLYPLLRAVQPGEINKTLNAVATALEGRGTKIGENLETVDSYLKRLNPQIPAIIEDLRLTSKVSVIYSDALPEIAEILRNTIKTTTTLKEQRKNLDTFFTDISRFSQTSRTFLRRNGDNLIRLGELGAAQLKVLAKYAPEYPCLTSGIVNAGKRQAEAFRGFTLHIVLETLPAQPRGYTAADVPRFGENRGPNCLHLPNPPWSQSNPVLHQPDFNDGVDSPTGKGTSRVAPGFGAEFTGGLDEAGLLRSMIAPGLGVVPDEVPDLGVLLVAPMARGAEVSLR